MCTQNNISYGATKTHPFFSRRKNHMYMNTMLDKRSEPHMQLTDLIYSILLICYHKLVLTAFGLTSNDAKKPYDELDAYIQTKRATERNM